LSSGYAAGANTSALIKLTGFEILTKPYDPDRMLHVVRSALDLPKDAPREPRDCAAQPIEPSGSLGEL
jgi:DNA-binding NtrC family response regulator